MEKFIDWITKNSLFMTTTIAFVFAFLTIIFLLVLTISNSSTKRQLKTLTKSMQYDHRPRIIPKFINLDGRIKCLVFENTGSQYAKNVSIIINKEWLEAKERLNDFPGNNAILAQLHNKKLMLSPGEKLSYSLYIVGAGMGNVELFKNQLFKAAVRYTDNAEQNRYEETFLLDLALHEDTVAGTSDFIRGMNRIGEKIDKIEPAIRDLDFRVSELVNVNKDANELNERRLSFMKKSIISTDSKKSNEEL